MKRIFVFLISSLFILIACNPSKDDEATTKANSKIEINHLIDQWHIDAAKADLKAYLAFMDSASVFIGTDPTENWDKTSFETFCKPFFEKGQTWDFKPLERNLYLDSKTQSAWFDELLDTQMGICRGSGILINTKQGWKLQQYVLSISIPNEKTNQVVEIKRSIDSLLISKYQ